MSANIVIALLMLLATVLWPLERTHRRTRHLPRITQQQRCGIPQWW